MSKSARSFSRTWRVGTRGSGLALAQTRQVLRLLRAAHPGRRFRLVAIRTSGDRLKSASLFRSGETGVFTKAIEKKLLKREIDLAVHSLKDLPTKLPRSLMLAACPTRLDPRDVLISRGRFTLQSLPAGAKVGTGSPRRQRQIQALRPDVRVCDLRGNLDTRVSKVLQSRELDAIVVARAGLLRIKKFIRYARPIAPHQMLPAVGQGALAIEARRDDKEALELARSVGDEKTLKEALAERRLLHVLRGGCRVPVGVLSRVKKKTLYLSGAVFSVRSNRFVRAEASGPLSRPEKVGEELARRLLRGGASRFLSEMGRAGR